MMLIENAVRKPKADLPPTRICQAGEELISVPMRFVGSAVKASANELIGSATSA
jgi:hypothetical protein